MDCFSWYRGWYWNTNTPGSYATFTAAVTASSTNLRDTTANYNGGLLAKNMGLMLS
jgi:hypothetical protein